MRTVEENLPVIAILSWMATSVAFLVFSLKMGGAAITGKIVAGHYYLGSHGNYPEVSRGTYILSALLSGAFGLSLPLFTGVMTWHESRKPSFSKIAWIGIFFTLVFGLVTCLKSIQCLLNAFA